MVILWIRALVAGVEAILIGTGTISKAYLFSAAKSYTE
jgi:hypothetical protein